MRSQATRAKRWATRLFALARPRSRGLARTITAAALLLSFPAWGQSEGSGRLEEIPFELPFELSSEAVSDDVLVQVFDASFDECVEFFQTSFVERAELAPGWTIGGQGLDTSTQNWRFGLLYQSRVLYDVVVRRDAGGCAVEVGADADPIPGGRWRWSFPPLQLSDGTPITADPLVVED